jgi:hypothetical protein
MWIYEALWETDEFWGADGAEIPQIKI